MDILKIKTKWAEVNIEEWIAIGQVEENPELNGLNIAKRIKVAAIISNKTEDEIGEMYGENWGKILKATTFVEKNPAKKKAPKDGTPRVIKLNDTDYIFHPQPQQMNAGEQASIEQLLVEQNNGGDIATAGLLAILIRPAVRVRNEEFNRDDITIEKFDTANMDERKALFLKQLTVDQVWHEWVFFYGLGRKLSEHSPQYTPPKKQRKKGKR